jgi:hypothetical protein
MIRRLCPVCHQKVQPTRDKNIGGHLDSIRADVCPGTGNPFRITVAAGK